MFFLDALKTDLVDLSCVMVYGSVTDQFLSGDLCFREIHPMMHHILKDSGYENVVFYDFSGGEGKYVYDDESAYYSIANAKQPYERKYGCPPKHGSVSSASAQNNQSQPQQTAAPGGKIRRFGHQPKVVGSVPVQNPNQQPTDPNDENTVIPYNQPNLDPALFNEELRQWMNDQSVRTAFVFDLMDFLNNDGVRQNQYQIQYLWRNPRAIIIFINTFGNNLFQNHAALSAFQQSSLYDYFCIRDANGNPAYNDKRCFPIMELQKDEILFLFQRLRLFHDVRYEEGMEAAADKINYFLRNKKEPTELRTLSRRADVYLETNSGSLGENFYEALCQERVESFDYNPLEQLAVRAGWENATRLLVDKLLDRCQHFRGENCPAQDLANQIRWLTEGNAGRSQLPEYTAATQRFGSAQPKVYPTAPELPHIILIGNPGTGKSTAANMLGRIFHDVGLLSSGHVRHVDGGSLQGGYIGQTPIRVNELLDSAENGVLFIDEAYNLCKDFDSPGNAGTFSQEAVNTLVNAMEDPRRHVLLIFAGYPSSESDRYSTTGVLGISKMNPGFLSRVRLELEIKDYLPEVLTDLFMSAIERENMSLSEELSRDNILAYMTYHYQTRTNMFGNGRFVNNVAANCVSSARMRLGNAIGRVDFGDEEEYLDPITMESVVQELDAFPGLSDIGNKILRRTVNLYQNRRNLGDTDPGTPGHIVLKGKRGTGKSTLVHLLCKAWGCAGIMSGQPPVEITNPGVCTPDELQRAVRDAIAKRTVLFLDEAHNATRQMITSLLSPMEENKNLTCIFAVYPEKEYEEAFKELDPGITDRCTWYEIPDYTPDQLTEIFKSMAKKVNRHPDQTCVDALHIYFENVYESREGNHDYSNARMVRRILEEMEAASDQAVLTEADIPAEVRKVIANRRHRFSFDEIIESFHDYVGWESLREYLEDTKTLIDYKKMNPATRLDFGHLVFAGSPGTGKSTAAELFGRACYALGLLRTDRFLKYSVKDLIGQYMGETRRKTQEALEKGIDGVIFIDEAYNLHNVGGMHSYEDEAVDVLLNFSAEQMGKTLIVLAGYENKMGRFLSTNPGLSSRFTRTIRFRDFTPGECVQILEDSLKRSGATVAREVTVEATSRFAEHVPGYRDWGNARDVNNIATRVIQYHARRMVSTGSTEDIVTVEDLMQGWDAWERDRIAP